MELIFHISIQIELDVITLKAIFNLSLFNLNWLEACHLLESIKTKAKCSLLGIFLNLILQISKLKNEIFIFFK